MTVRELRSECDSIIKLGYGDYNIAISRDDEGNGYHELLYTFLTDKKTVKNAVKWSGCENDVSDTDNLVLLG